MQFVKMHGAGNDYVYLDLFRNEVPDEERLPGLARELSDRNYGIGGDGLILIMPSDVADARMRMFNSDGSEAEMCGNGIRCVAKYVVDEKLVDGNELDVETGQGILHLQAYRNNQSRVDRVRVGMGKPDFEPANVPVTGLGSEPVLGKDVSVDGNAFTIHAVSMGNPHSVVFVDNVREYPVAKLGSLLENASCFPRRANIEFVEIVDDTTVRVRTWERGSGETLACGTGASAVCAVLVKVKNWNGPVRAILLGGELTLEWTDQIYMTGPATEVFRGEYRPG